MSTFIGMDVNKNKPVEEEQIIASLNEQVNTLTTEKEKIQSQLDKLKSSTKSEKEE